MFNEQLLLQMENKYKIISTTTCWVILPKDVYKDIKWWY